MIQDSTTSHNGSLGKRMRKIKANTLKFLCNLVSALIFWDKDMRHRVRDALHPYNQRRCVDYLKRYCLVTDAPAQRPHDSQQGKHIWQFWAQGEESAPVVIAKCLESVRKHIPEGYEYHLITEENISEYVQFPEYIYEHKREGRITMTHFSDILRVALLDRYGGLWIDASCLLTDSIPQHILDAEFFCYRSQGEFAHTFIQSCFMKGVAGNVITKKLLSGILRYWSEEEELIHYFVLHYLFQSFLKVDEDYQKLYNETATGEDDGPMHYLYYALRAGRQCDDALIAESAQQSFIHKLTYKEPHLFANCSW